MTKVDMHIPGKSDLDVSFDGSRKIHQEAPFERYISRKVAGLEHSGWALSPDDTGFDPNDALVFDDFVAWLEATAPEKLDKMRREKGARWADQLKRALVKSLERNGTVLTLRKGFQMAGYQTIECMAGYPDDERVPGARERYDANILRFMHQVHYQTAGSKSLDFVLFVNGIPVATGEVKTELTQTVRDAIDEYADERKPVEPDGGRKNPLLMYKRGAVVHFAVSEDEVWMCTNLGPFPSKSARPRFLPFNLGRDGGAGNPDAPEAQTGDPDRPPLPPVRRREEGPGRRARARGGAPLPHRALGRLRQDRDHLMGCARPREAPPRGRREDVLERRGGHRQAVACLLYTSDAADE